MADVLMLRSDKGAEDLTIDNELLAMTDGYNVLGRTSLFIVIWKAHRCGDYWCGETLLH